MHPFLVEIVEVFTRAEHPAEVHVELRRPPGLVAEFVVAILLGVAIAAGALAVTP